MVVNHVVVHAADAHALVARLVLNSFERVYVCFVYGTFSGVALLFVDLGQRIHGDIVVGAWVGTVVGLANSFELAALFGRRNSGFSVIHNYILRSRRYALVSVELSLRRGNSVLGIGAHLVLQVLVVLIDSLKHVRQVLLLLDLLGKRLQQTAALVGW